MFKKSRSRRIPSGVYNNKYFLSKRLEGFDEFKKGSLSFIKSKQLKMLRLQKGMTLLEVGFGRGELLRGCAESGARVTGIDYSKAALAVAKKTLSGFPQARILAADGRKIPFDSNSFQRVFSGDVIEHLSFEDGVKMLKEMYRVLAPGGFMLVHTAPNTIFTRIVYPLVKPVLKLVDKTSIKEIDDHLVFSKKVHIHEYNWFSLQNAAKKADLVNARVRIDRSLLRSGKHRLIKNLKRNPFINFIDSLGRIFLVRFFLGNDLYLKVFKKNG